MIMSTLTAEHPAVDSNDAGSSSLDSNQIEHISDICDRAADGDLEARITEIDTNGSLAGLCHSINHMLDIADAFIRESAAAMKECGHDRFHRPILLRGLKGAYRKGATLINQAVDKMRKNKEQIAATEGLAAACEELGSSNTEIARQASDSAKLTEAAVLQAKESAVSVQTLQESMQRIDRFLAVINKIAEQTNLLALNATIEAARAGEHGRGFAVVANGVKELSRNSASAARDIGVQLEAMRKSTQQAVASINNMNSSITRINAGAESIATAVQQQVQANAEISRYVTAISHGISGRNSNT